MDALTIGFDYEGEVTGEDAREILDKIRVLHQRAMNAANTARSADRAESLRMFAVSLEKAFYETPLVSISNSQRRPLPEANWQAIV